MKKKSVLIALLVVLVLGIAFLGQWYAEKKRNEAIARDTQTFDLGKGVTLEMVRLPAGTFRMGSGDGAISLLSVKEECDYIYEGTETPAHTVNLDGFWIGKYEVTQEQYETIMGENRSSFWGVKENPVDSKTWDDAMEFCKALTSKTGTSFTLPTEAQWEYACRAGSTTAFCYGNDESILGDYAWYMENSRQQTHPVGQKMPNAWGLYDMHGNVWEWCRDYYDHYFYRTSADTMKNPENTKKARKRVLRGGAWAIRRGVAWWDPNGPCRSAYRYNNYPDTRNNLTGFRIVRTQP